MLKKLLHAPILCMVLGTSVAMQSLAATNRTFSCEYSEQSMPLSRVLTDPRLRTQFNPFLTNVLRQVPADAFWQMIDTIQADSHPQTDQEWYENIIKNINSIKPRFFAWHQLKALDFQKKVLGKQ